MRARRVAEGGDLHGCEAQVGRGNAADAHADAGEIDDRGVVGGSAAQESFRDRRIEGRAVDLVEQRSVQFAAGCPRQHEYGMKVLPQGANGGAITAVHGMARVPDLADD